MLSKEFMRGYISFISSALTVAIVGPTYYFLTKLIASFVQEDYRQTFAVALGVLAVAASHQMMAVIEKDKELIIDDIESYTQRIIGKK